MAGATIPVLYKKGEKHFKADFVDFGVTNETEVTGNPMEIRDGYMALASYLRKRRVSPALTDSFKELAGTVDKLYIFFGVTPSQAVKQDEETAEDFDKVFWKKFCPTCERCVKSCKQSWKAKVINCPDYKKA